MQFKLVQKPKMYICMQYIYYSAALTWRPIMLRKNIIYRITSNAKVTHTGASMITCVNTVHIVYYNIYNFYKIAQNGSFTHNATLKTSDITQQQYMNACMHTNTHIYN